MPALCRWRRTPPPPPPPSWDPQTEMHICGGGGGGGDKGGESWSGRVGTTEVAATVVAATAEDERSERSRDAPPQLKNVMILFYDKGDEEEYIHGATFHMPPLLLQFPDPIFRLLFIRLHGGLRRPRTCSAYRRGNATIIKGCLQRPAAKNLTARFSVGGEFFPPSPSSASSSSLQIFRESREKICPPIPPPPPNIGLLPRLLAKGQYNIPSSKTLDISILFLHPFLSIFPTLVELPSSSSSPSQGIAGTDAGEA